MLFQTLHYAIFLILVIGMYWSSPYRYRLHILGVASIVFYGSWNVNYVPLLVGVALLAWGLGRLFSHSRRPDAPTWIFGIALSTLFVPLAIFKYWDWVVDSITIALSWAGISINLPRRADYNIILPVGISFFTFQAASYLVDVRKNGEEENNPWRFISFLAFFPQLIAGPIVRQHELLPQLKKPLLLQRDDLGEALFRITKGLVKKLVFADLLYHSIIEQTFADPMTYRGIELWVALYAYTIWIYYDFSAYTDIAIGSAKLFGITLPENFNRPYQSSSVAEFWRKWHITLSNWVRDYIYFPLGGTRTDKAWKAYRNIIITMVVIGIWHGASWNFVIYGTLHGSAVSINRWQRKRTGRMPGQSFDNRWSWLWRFLLTFHFVVVARILFGTKSIVDAWDYFLGLGDLEWVLPRFYSPLPFAVLALGYAWHFTPREWTDERIKSLFISLPTPAKALVVGTSTLLCWQLTKNAPIAFAYYEF